MSLMDDLPKNDPVWTSTKSEVDYKALSESQAIQIKTLSLWAEKKEKQLNKARRLLDHCRLYHNHTIQGADQIEVFLHETD